MPEPTAIEKAMSAVKAILAGLESELERVKAERGEAWEHARQLEACVGTRDERIEALEAEIRILRKSLKQRQEERAEGCKAE